MKVTIDFQGFVIGPVIQEHLDQGIQVQMYVQQSVVLMNAVVKAKREGQDLAFFEKGSTYITEIYRNSFIDSIVKKPMLIEED